MIKKSTPSIILLQRMKYEPIGKGFPYAKICVDIQNDAVDRLFEYAIPHDLQAAAQAGMRVLVPFGRRSKPIDGYIISLSDSTAVPNIKPICGLYEDYPVFTPDLLDLAKWMHTKYYTSLANCLNCILPPGLPKRPISKPWGSAPHPARDLSLDPSFKKRELLTQGQLYAIGYILKKLEEGDTQPVLIHGVTGSGKTEVYLSAIAKVLEQGRQAIMLVPEIALTPQIVSVFKEHFGDSAAVTHSRLTAKERLGQWQKARRGEVSVIIGPRSAVFAPFERLGIIIIDEEHEHSYRSESSPKFDTRCVAIKRAELVDALVVMGSATPSLESYQLAKEKKTYALLEMPQRVNKMFPQVNIVDMRRELAAGNTSIFGQAFQNAAAEELAKGRQIILFLNRRGHSTFVSCRRCGHVMGCDNCRVNYTYHAGGIEKSSSSGVSYDNKQLLCHYCGRSAPVPKTCPACSSAFIRYFGVGTQKVEEEVARLFPETKFLRMDMDTTRRKHGHAKILSAFRKGEAQILIGTQMIAKGLDFPNVTLVGIIAADLSLFTGDFRAAEHTFQLLTQVSGRAGRAEQSGRVFIQTYNPGHYSITLAQNADYTAFYEHELALRRTMGYPPFSHVFMLLFTGPDEPALIKALHKLLAIMNYCNKKKMFEMLGPAPAFISKIKRQFRWKLLVKCTQEEILKQFVLYCLGVLRENDPLKGISINITLDPMAME